MFKNITILIFMFLTIVAKGNDSLKANINLTGVFDSYNNCFGGLTSGSVYRGLLTANSIISYKFIGLKLSAAFANGKSPSTYLVGDLQSVSNIDANLNFFLFEVYFQYKNKSNFVKMGIHNLNEDFVACENASELINSSFGIPSLITVNSYASVYPKTTLGLSYTYKMEKSKLKLALFDGFPDEIKNNELFCGIHLRDGFVNMVEIEKTINPIRVIIGNFNHTGSLSHFENQETIESSHIVYSILSTNIDSTKHLFLQLAHSLSQVYQNYYVGSGIKLDYKVGKKHFNLSIGIAKAGNKIKNKNETVIEISNAIHWKYFKVIPDIQYVINPSGMNKKLNNALMFNFRLNFFIHQ